MTRLLLLLAAMMGWAWRMAHGAEPLPPRALARIGDYRFYHGPGLTRAVLSPDGSRIASAATYFSYRDKITDKKRDAYNRQIILWNAATGERMRTLRTPNLFLWNLAFSPHGKWLAVDYRISKDRCGVVLFEVETGKTLRRFEMSANRDFAYPIIRLEFSADGKQLRVSEIYGSVSAWDMVSGKQVRQWKRPATVPPRKNQEGVAAVEGRLSPDGKVIVWQMLRFTEGVSPWDSAGLRVHDAATDKLLYQKKILLFRPLRCLAFSSDGNRFAADRGDTLTVWETATGKELTALDLPEMNSFALVPDGRRAVILERGSRLRLWNLETKKPLQELNAGFISPISRLFSKPQVLSADGRSLLLATDSTLRLFDMKSGKERAFLGHRAPVTPRFSADGRTLFTSCGERRCSWDITSESKPTLLRQEPRKTWEVDGLAYSADERFFLRSERPPCVRETATGRVMRRLECDRFSFSGRISPDATRVLLHDPESELHPEEDPELFRLFDGKTGRATGEIKPVHAVGSPEFSPNGRLIAWLDQTGAIHLHDAVTGKSVRVLRSSRPLGNEKICGTKLLFSPAGKQLIDASSLKAISLPLRVFRITDGREIARFYADPERKSGYNELSCVACSPDGRLLAVGEYESETVRILEIASGKVRIEFAGHRHGVHGLAFSPDGKTLASGGEDNIVFLWDVSGTHKPNNAKPAREIDLAACWKDLASEDGKRAGLAIAAMLRKPKKSVAFLKDRLHPAQEVDKKHLAHLLSDLDSDDFDRRQAASRELAQLGERVEVQLRQALTRRPSLEMRRRIEDLLNKLDHGAPPEIMRELRAIEVLEHIGTPAARRCLDALAKGAAEARQTCDAKEALERLAKLYRADASGKHR